MYNGFVARLDEDVLDLSVEKVQSVNVQLEDDTKIVLEMRSQDVLDLNLIQDDSLQIQLDTPVARGGGGEEYDGPYEFTSALYNDQIAATQYKTMKRNVVIHPIPIFEVDNPQGGTTVTIGL